MNVYVNLHHELRAEVASSLDCDPNDLQLRYSRPPAMRRLLEPLFQGDELVLDLQWSTEARSRRGQMIRLGEIEALAFVARQKDVTKLKKALGVDLIVPEIAKDLALDDPDEYRRISVSLREIFNLFSSRPNDFKLFVQNDSAIQDKILYMSQERIEGATEEESQARSEDMNEMADSLEAIHTLLKDMAITSGTTGVVIEWNPVSPLPEIRQVFRKCRIDAPLHDPLAKERRFVVFPARYTEPLDAGYYYPEGDEEFGTALRNALFRSYTWYNGDRLEWHPDAIELARQTCVKLDPVEEVFARVDDTGNVVPITQAARIAYGGQS